VVRGSAWRGEDLRVAQWHPSVEGVGDRGVPQRVRADVARDAGGLGDADDHAVTVAAVDRVAGERTQDQWPFGPFAPAGLQHPKHRDGQRHSGWFVALADQVQNPVPSQRLAVVLDPHRRSASDARRALIPSRYARAPWWTLMVGATCKNRISSSLGTGLVPVDLGQPGVDGRVVRDQPVDVGEPEVAADPCIIVLIDEGINPHSPRCRMNSSTCARWIPANGSRRFDSHKPNQRRNW